MTKRLKALLYAILLALVPYGALAEEPEIYAVQTLCADNEEGEITMGKIIKIAQLGGDYTPLVNASNNNVCFNFAKLGLSEKEYPLAAIMPGPPLSQWTTPRGCFESIRLRLVNPPPNFTETALSWMRCPEPL